MSKSAQGHPPGSQGPQEARILQPVVQALMTAALGLAQAQRGVLLRWQAGELLVEALAHAGPGQVVVDLGSSAPHRDELPLALIGDVVRTRAPARLESHPDRVLVVLPLLERACLAGMLVLERQGPGPRVTDEQMRFLELLAGQAAVSLDTARRYAAAAGELAACRQDELASSRAQAELARGARLATIGQMTSLVAHEVSQPLMSISSNAGAALIRLERNARDTDKFRQLLREIVEQSQRAGSIIRRLQALAYRRPQAGPVDLHILVHQVLLAMRGELDRHRIAVELDLRDRPISFEGDATQLRQVLANLVANAVDAMHAVEGRARTLHIASRSLEGRQVEVSVEDNGSGADAATYAHMFEPFVGTKPDGMGMGLAICRSIIESHGGRIEARDRQPHGCSVIFTMAEGAGTAPCCETG